MGRKTTVYMVVDVESIGFGIGGNGDVNAVKYEDGKMKVRNYEYGIYNPFLETTKQTNDLVEKILTDGKIEFGRNGNAFSIPWHQDHNKIKRLFKHEHVGIGSNGLTFVREHAGVEFDKAAKKNKDRAKERMARVGYTTDYSKLCYDIGYAISSYNRVTKEMDIVTERSFLIKEVWENEELMQSAYFAKNIPLYKEKIAKGEIVVMSYKDIMGFMEDDINTFGVDVFTAYNAGFDTSAIATTCRLLEVPLPPSFRELDVQCIWTMAVDMLLQRPSYVKFALKHGFISESYKFFKTSAETTYAYLKKLSDFEEEHTGLEDVLIETFILGQCLRQGKSKMEKEIKGGLYKNLAIAKYANVSKLEDRTYTPKEIKELLK